MWFILNPLSHLRAVRRWADQNQTQVHLSARTCSLTLTRGKHVLRMAPRFVVQNEGQLAYTPEFEEEGNFAGWPPPQQESWPLAQDKMAFKRGASAMGLRLPSAWNSGKHLAKDFLIKSRTGSFGAQVHGPFTAATWDAAKALDRDMYFEQFVAGRSAKAWCFNGRVIVLELVEPPYLEGDGVRSLNELAAQRGNVGKALPLDKAAAMLDWQGLTVNSVPEPGQKVWLDFKYATPFDQAVYGNRNVWMQQDGKLRNQFARAASLLQTSLPDKLRMRGLFTLDAVIDTAGRAWFLEMNSHPMVHPDVYDSMLTSLLSQ